MSNTFLHCAPVIHSSELLFLLFYSISLSPSSTISLVGGISLTGTTCVVALAGLNFNFKYKFLYLLVRKVAAMPCEIGELPKKEMPMIVEHTETKIEMDEDAHDEDEVRRRKKTTREREGEGQRQLTLIGVETTKWNSSIRWKCVFCCLLRPPVLPPWFIVGTLWHINFPVDFHDFSQSLQIASKASSDHSGPEDDYKIDKLFYRICYVSDKLKGTKSRKNVIVVLLHSWRQFLPQALSQNAMSFDDRRSSHLQY